MARATVSVATDPSTRDVMDFSFVLVLKVLTRLRLCALIARCAVVIG